MLKYPRVPSTVYMRKAEALEQSGPWSSLCTCTYMQRMETEKQSEPWSSEGSGRIRLGVIGLLKIFQTHLHSSIAVIPKRPQSNENLWIGLEHKIYSLKNSGWKLSINDVFIYKLNMLVTKRYPSCTFYIALHAVNKEVQPQTIFRSGILVM